MSSTHLFPLVLKIVLKITNSKNSIFQGQQKKVMGRKNVRKTKSYAIIEKIFKSVKGLQKKCKG